MVPRAMSVEVISSGSDSDDDDHFFDAAPGLKRSGGADYNDGQHGAGTPSTSSNGPSSYNAAGPPGPSSPHKRMRTQAPAPPQGVKRSKPHAPANGNGNATTNGHQSDSDISFQGRSRPTKKTKVDDGDAQGEDEDSEEEIQFLQTINAARPPPARRRAPAETTSGGAGGIWTTHLGNKRGTKTTRSRPRVSSSFNFTPSVELTRTHPDTIKNTNLIRECEALRHKGNAYYRSRAYAQALAIYTDALEKYPMSLDCEPPISLLSNRAAAYMSLGRWEDALRDMRTALSYPCYETVENVKRLTRYLRCLLALAKLGTEEAQEALKHAKIQLTHLQEEGGSEGQRVVQDAAKVIKDFKIAEETLEKVNRAREAAEWPLVLTAFDSLETTPGIVKANIPSEWTMMRAEALGWQGRADEASKLVNTFLSKAAPQDPAALWLKGLFAYASGDMKQAISTLDALRLVTDMHIQANRLLHRAYKINALLDQVPTFEFSRQYSKVLVILNEVLRLASADQPVNNRIRLYVLMDRARMFHQTFNDSAAFADLQTISKQKNLPDLIRFRESALWGQIALRENKPNQAILHFTAALKDVQGVPPMEVNALRRLLATLKPARPAQAEKPVWSPSNVATPREILGVSPTATAAEIKKAYRKESLKHHPDKPGGDAERFKRLNTAYQALNAELEGQNSPRKWR